MRADGRILPVIANSVQKRSGEGAVLSNRITLFDSTDRKRYERELLLARRRAEQIVKEKADLLSMLSHDIRNPLNAVMGVVQLLERSELNERQRRHLQFLKSSSENMLKLLERVLELSKAESSSYALAKTPFAMPGAGRGRGRDVQPSAQAKGLRAAMFGVRRRTGRRVLGDPVVLRQILTNLVGNAIKFTQSGEVVVTVHAGETTAEAVTLHFAVSDTGIGIPPDRLDQHLQGVHAGERRDRGDVRRQRPGPRDLTEAAGPPRQRSARRQHARRGVDVFVHRAADVPGATA